MLRVVKPFDYARDRLQLLDSTGRRLTSGLFDELANPDSAIKPLFKLSEWRDAYIAIADPTDYKAALHLIGDWEHWQYLMGQCQAFVVEVKKWREEVAVKLASEAIVNLREQAKKPTGIGAAKWLAERGFQGKTIGRPKKNTEESGRISDDYKRVMGS